MAGALGQIWRGQVDTDRVRARPDAGATYRQRSGLPATQPQHPSATRRSRCSSAGHPLAACVGAMSAYLDYLAQIETVVRAAAIHSPTGFSWFGVPSATLPETVKRALTPKTARSYLLYNLQYQLYHNFYCQ